MADRLVDKLSDHVERFECTVYGDGRLVLFTEPPPWGNRKRGKHVGQARKVGDMDWRIERLEVAAVIFLLLPLSRIFFLLCHYFTPLWPTSFHTNLHAGLCVWVNTADQNLVVPVPAQHHRADIDEKGMALARA